VVERPNTQDWLFTGGIRVPIGIFAFQIDPDSAVLSRSACCHLHSVIGQITGSGVISGTVTDPNGAVVPGVSVAIKA